MNLNLEDFSINKLKRVLAFLSVGVSKLARIPFKDAEGEVLDQLSQGRTIKEVFDDIIKSAGKTPSDKLPTEMLF